MTRGAHKALPQQKENCGEIMRIIIQWLDRLEMVIMGLASIAIMSMMLLISSDALGRYFFDSPISGVNEFVTLYLIVAVVYLGLSNTFKENEHISVTIIFDRFPQKVKNILLILNNFIGLFLFMMIFYEGWRITYTAFLTNESHVGVVIFPLFAAYGLVPLGSAFMILRFIINIYSIVRQE